MQKLAFFVFPLFAALAMVAYFYLDQLGLMKSIVGWVMFFTLYNGIIVAMAAVSWKLTQFRFKQRK